MRDKEEIINNVRETGKVVHIHLDKPNIPVDILSNNEVRQVICRKDEIHTYCLNFANLEWLEFGVDVIIHHNSNNTQLALSDLLEGKYYNIIKREIRIEHNTHKMLLAGVFDKCFEVQ